MDRINSFRGKYRFLSNFYPSPVEWLGDLYPSVEHAFQAAKAMPDADRVRLAIRAAETPGRAKQMGRRLQLRPNWDAIRVGVMHLLLKRKFEIPELRKQLIDTGTIPLEEGNTWGDRFWGTVAGEGENNLGKLLMKVREELQP